MKLLRTFFGSFCWLWPLPLSWRRAWIITRSRYFLYVGFCLSGCGFSDSGCCCQWVRGVDLLWRCWSGSGGVRILVSPEVLLPCCCVAEHVDGQEAGQASDRIQNLLGCHQSCAEFMPVKRFKVGDSAQSNQTVLEQLWANCRKTQ